MNTLAANWARFTPAEPPVICSHGSTPRPSADPSSLCALDLLDPQLWPVMELAEALCADQWAHARTDRQRWEDDQVTKARRRVRARKRARKPAVEEPWLREVDSAERRRRSGLWKARSERRSTIAHRWLAGVGVTVVLCVLGMAAVGAVHVLNSSWPR
ncbi:hypothetical protein [Longispora albida]|uniref:hypothetical protein n=1 Tax=Longispora albida TaxID=203523 RepID=UPI00036BBAA8|nr:hypothetical protein [Longispora albida]